MSLTPIHISTNHKRLDISNPNVSNKQITWAILGIQFLKGTNYFPRKRITQCSINILSIKKEKSKQFPFHSAINLVILL